MLNYRLKWNKSQKKQKLTVCQTSPDYWKRWKHPSMISRGSFVLIVGRFLSPDPLAAKRIHPARDWAAREREVHARADDQLCERTSTVRTSGLEFHRITRPGFLEQSEPDQVSLESFQVFLKMGQPRPLFRLFSVFSNKLYNFCNK